MEEQYSVELCKKLEKKFLDTGMHRPMRVERYDDGTEFEFDIRKVGGTDSCRDVIPSKSWYQRA